MADCKKYREMISAYADGELSGNVKNAFESHLDACASCRSLLSLYKGVTEATEDSLKEPPAGFAASVMSKIKSLSEDESTWQPTANKKGKSIKPVIISFVAAAACLVMAFIVTPELFGFTNLRNSTASVPMPSSAPGLTAGYDTASAPADANILAEAKSADISETDSATGDGLESAPEAQFEAAGTSQMPAASAAPDDTTAQTPAPSFSPQIAATGKSEEVELKIYYAIFVIKGQLPDDIVEKSKLDNGDGSYNIEISAETAKKLIEDGYTAIMGATESATALIKYTPPA